MLRKALFFIAIIPIFAGFFSAPLPAKAGFNFSALIFPDPIILPTSPLYFLKEWRRGFLRAVTKDPLSQIVLEMDILDEKAAELRKIRNVKPEDFPGLERSLTNYKETQDELRKRLENAPAIRDERDRETLAKELFERLAYHNNFFSELSEAYAENTEVSEALDSAKGKIADSAVSASGAVSEEVLKNIIRAAFIASSSTSTASSSISVIEYEIVERMKGVAPDKVRRALDELLAELSSSTATSTATSSASSTATSTVPVVCILIFEPVCGEDGKTYSNSCFASAAGVKVKFKGECGTQ